jgi:acyl-coenzyme A thioesterase PaaI-like protein
LRDAILDDAYSRCDFAAVTPAETNSEVLAKFLNDSELFKFLNLSLVYIEDQIHIRLDPIEDRHRGGSTGDSVNGAVVAAICDIAVGATIGHSRHSATTGSAVGRLDIKMRKPIRGNYCTAVARIKKQAKNLVYATVTFFDDQGNRCVEAEGTVFMKTI